MGVSLPVVLTFLKNKLRLYYNKVEVDAKISDAITKEIIWKPVVTRGMNTTDEAALQVAYPVPLEGWTATVAESNKMYRYDIQTNTWLNIGGGSGNAIDIEQLNHGFSVGTWLRRIPGSYALASSSSETEADVIGVVAEVKGPNAFMLLTGGYLDGLSNLTDGATYFLSNVPGEMTKDVPTRIGAVNKPVFAAVSSNGGYVINYRGYVLTATGDTIGGGGKGNNFEVAVGATILDPQPTVFSIGEGLSVSTEVVPGSVNSTLSGLTMSTVLSQVYKKTDIDLKLQDIYGTGLYTTNPVVSLWPNLKSVTDIARYLMDTMPNMATKASSIAGYGITNAYTKAEINTILDNLAPSDNVYTKTEVDTLLNNLAPSTNVYTKTEVDSLLNGKSNTATTLLGYGITNAYTKTEVDTIIGTKATKATTLLGYGITDAYTITQIDTNLATKASKSTTLAGYGITDTYTITQIDTKFLAKENSLGNPAIEGAILRSTTSGSRYWTEGKLGHTLQINGVSLTQRSNLNFIGGMQAYDDPVLTDTTTVAVDIPQNGTALWSTDADFNANGATFTSGLLVPAANNELSLAASSGVLVDEFVDTYLVDAAASHDVVVAGGVAKVGIGIDSGTGADGDFTIPAATTIVFSTGNATTGNTFSNSYTCTALGINYAIVTNVGTGITYAVGDELLIINVMGTSTYYSNVGNYEFVRVASVNTTLNKITFTTNKVRCYGNTAGSDANIGITRATNQIVFVQRVPNWNIVTLNASTSILDCSGFISTATSVLTGIICFRCKTLNNYGTIRALGRGYYSYLYGGVQSPGLGIAGTAQIGGAGNAGSGSGSHVGTGTGNNSTTPVYDVYNDLSKLYFGGSGGSDDYITRNTYGGVGGGIIAIFSDLANITGTLSAAGTAGGLNASSGNYTGSGAGGTILLAANTVNYGTNSITVAGAITGAIRFGGVGKVILTYQYKTGNPTINATATPFYNLVSSVASSGLLSSTNMLVGKTVTSIKSVLVNVTVIPIDGTLGIQFSTDGTTFYNVAGANGSTTALVYGNNTLDIEWFGWTTNNFYYRLYFTCATTTPEVSSVAVNFAPKVFSLTDQTWVSSPFSVASGVAIRPKTVISRWTTAAGNAQPKFQLIGSVTSNFSAPSYFPTQTTYYQGGSGNSIVSGTELNIETQVNAFFNYWKLVVVLNAGGNQLVSPSVQDFSFTYVSEVQKILDAASIYTLELKRGTKSSLPTSLQQGEPYIALDTKELYIGNGVSIAASKVSDIAVQTTTPTGIANLVWVNPTTKIIKFWNTQSLQWVEIYSTPTITTAPQVTVSITSGSITLDCSLYNIFKTTLNANITSILRTNVPSTRSYRMTLILVSDGTQRTINWGTIRWNNSAIPTPTASVNKIDIFEFLTYDGGTTWFGQIIGQNM
jgi:hypothetical protein